MKDAALVSVVIPCFRQAVYLPDAVQSVLDQTYGNWECIIVNDGSDDDTDAVAQQWCARDSRIKYHRQNNKGLSAARNAGIRIASGHYILPLDADDKVSPSYLEKAIALFGADAGISVVYCDAEFFGLKSGRWELPPYSYRQLLIENLLFCSAIYKKADWVAAGGYDETLKIGLEDWSFWLKILSEDSIVVKIPETLFYYRAKQDSMRTSLSVSDNENIHWHVFLEHIDKFKTLYQSPISAYLETQRMHESESWRLGNFLVKLFKLFQTRKDAQGRS